MANRKDDLIRQRLEKLRKIYARGTNPYPHRFKRTHTALEASSLLESQEKGESSEPPTLVLAGRIVASRGMGKASFLDLRDGSGKIQVYFRQDLLGEETYTLLQDLDLGDIIGVRGKLFRTRTGEVTLGASELTILCKALQPLPEKWHGLADVEKRYRQRYLDLISNEETRQVFRARGRIITALRRFLDDRGFVEVQTPVLSPGAGGAMARPFITHHHALEQDLYLRIATELHLKRLVIGGFDKVYEIGPIFRNEGISTKHNPEFTMLECYEAYADYNDVMEMVEQMVSSIAEEVLGTRQVSFNDTTIDLSPPWKRITLREAIREHCGIDFEEHADADSLRSQMLASGLEVEEGLSRGKLIDHLLTSIESDLVQPIFLLDYPVEMSPLSKRKPDNDRLVERFEGFAAGMEIANAFTELNDPIEQRERFQDQLRQRESGDEEAELPDEDFLLALEYGMPPTGGLGIGIDRLVMLLTNQRSIREVILFPQLRTR